MQDKAKIWITFIVSFFTTTSIAIVISGAVLGEPTMLINNNVKVTRAEERAEAAESATRSVAAEVHHAIHPNDHNY